MINTDKVIGHSNPIGDNWDDFEKTIFTPEEIATSNLRIALVNEIIAALQERGITQKELEAVSGASLI